MSVVMGLALNTMFQPPTPSPTPTISTPSSSNSQLWHAVVPQPNRSLGPSTSFSQVKDCSFSCTFEQMALSIYDSRATAISVTSPSSISLIVPSTSKSTANSASCSIKIPDSKSSTDVAVRSAASLSKVPHTTALLSTVSSSSIVSSVPSAITDRLSKDVISGLLLPNHLKSIADAFDATTKALTEALGSDLADAADDLLTSFIERTDSVIQQSKGKARALGEQIQNLNEEVTFRNQRAKKRAKELKKKGGDIVRAAKEELKERTKKARKRARELREAAVDSGNSALKVCEKKRQARQRIVERKKCEHRRHSRGRGARVEKDKRRHSSGMPWAEYRARHFPF